MAGPEHERLTCGAGQKRMFRGLLGNPFRTKKGVRHAAKPKACLHAKRHCYMAGLTTNVMVQMGKDKPITLKNLERIGKTLECTPNDIFSFDDEYVEKRE